MLTSSFEIVPIGAAWDSRGAVQESSLERKVDLQIGIFLQFSAYFLLGFQLSQENRSRPSLLATHLNQSLESHLFEVLD